MDLEFETKILDIDIASLKEKLDGAVFTSRRLIKRLVFDLPNKEDKAWIRIIDNTLSYKNYKTYTIGGIEEFEFEVNPEKAAKLLKVLGCELIAEQYNYEQSCRWNDVEITIEEWPMIPPYIEIEGGSKSAVLEAIKRMGYVKHFPITTKMVYEKYGINLHDYKVLKDHDDL
ncbi:MAG: hypothetical protein PHW95_03755 [Patescibacteria group bacterium]|nr:hypothetical protein [Patescibacteria group bacterium]